jgi:hypothetical protein
MTTPQPTEKLEVQVDKIFELEQWKDIVDFLAANYESKLAVNFIEEVYSLTKGTK